MAAPTVINATELDFDIIKQNLISTFKANPKFTDYNFQGSNLSALIDVMAYTTHYLGLYANMAFSERFLDSAQMRNSLVSIAKELGYLPRQIRSAEATVHVVVPASSVVGNPTSVKILKNTEFTSQNSSGQNLIFLATTDFFLTLSGTDYIGDIIVVEGVPQVFKSLWTNSSLNVVLPIGNVDTRYLSVGVGNSAGSTPATWDLSTNILTNTANSTVYFLEEEPNNTLGVYFGDNVIGLSPVAGNEIVIDFITSSGEAGNSCMVFQAASAIDGIPANQFVLSSALGSSGGALPESATTISKTASGFYQSHDRAVTVEDYIAIIHSNISWIGALGVWGGETLTPPQYGNVYVSVNPAGASTTLTTSQIFELNTLLNKKKMVGIMANIIQPKLIYVDTTTRSVYDSTLTIDTTGTISATINAAIVNYFNFTNIKTLNMTLEYSKLLSTIDASHASLQSNITDIVLRCSWSKLQNNNLPATASAPATKTVIDFSNEIVSGSISTSAWTDSGMAVTIGVVGTTLTATRSDAFVVATGIIDYLHGTITFDPMTFPNTTVAPMWSAVPVSSNVVSLKNNLLVAGTQSTTVTPL